MYGVIRRSFPRIGVVVAALLTAVAVAAWSSSDAATNRTTTASESGTLRFLTAFPPTTFDPAYGPAFAGTFMDPVYEALIQTNSNDDPVPGLATRWKVQHNGVLLTLRKGVRFSDGTPFDANAVRGNITRAKKAGGQSASRLAAVTGVKVINPSTVLLQTKGAQPALIYSLTTAAGQMVSPRAFKAPDLGRHPVGAGPYMLDTKQTVTGSKYVYVKNPYYWNKAKQGVDKLILITIPDEAQRINALKSGQGDAAMIGDGEEYRAYKEAGFNVRMAPGDPLALIVVTPTGAFADQSVRQALGYAIDRKALQNTVYKDFGKAANQVFGPRKLGHLAKPPFAFGYNPAKAGQLLDSAGGAPPEIALPTLPWKIEETQALMGFLEAVGFKTKMDVVQPQQQLPLILAGKYAVAFLPLWEHDAAALAGSIDTKGYLNPRHVPHPKVQALARRAAAAAVSNPNLSQRLYGQMMAELAREGLVIPLIESSNGVAYTDKVKGMKAWPRWYTGTSLRGVRVTG